MLGVVIEVLVSGILLWWTTGKSLTALGTGPTAWRMKGLCFGILLAGGINAIYHLAGTYAAGDSWLVNRTFTSGSFINGFWWVLKSVLFEELLFRGALLYLAVRYLGEHKACWMSAIAFGCYHWFSYGIFGNPVQMLLIFLVTGLAGLMYAYAFSKTRSLYLPIGLHLGWNLVHIVVFSAGPLGQQWLIREQSLKLRGGPSLLLFLFQILVLPLIVLGYLGVFKKKNRSSGSNFI